MCWSFEVSIVSWLIGASTALFFLLRGRKNDLVLFALIATYSTMQLAEALMWSDQKCGKVNEIGTKIAYASLWAHPFAIGAGIYAVYGEPLPLFVGLGIFLTGLLFSPNFKCSKPSKKSCQHMVWGFDPSFYSLIFTIAAVMCFIYMRPFTYAAVALSFYAITFAISYATTKAFNTVGSYWCWVTAAFSVFVAMGTQFV